MNTNSDAGSGWVWTPVIEYYVAGQRFSSQFSYWQRINAKSKYSVGDEVRILYSPRNPSRCSVRWTWNPIGVGMPIRARATRCSKRRIRSSPPGTSCAPTTSGGKAQLYFTHHDSCGLFDLDQTKTLQRSNFYAPN